MTIVFVSNYYNHHQSEICREFDSQTEHHFWFIETEPMERERVNMGWANHGRPGYVMQSYADGATYDAATRLIDSADVVIWGSCPFKMIRPRLKTGKLTFAYSERIFKSGKRIGTLLRAMKYYLRLKPYQANHYLLCSSGYAATDYNQIGLFRDATFPWGYFPAVHIYDDIDDLIHRKKKNTILWTARMIPWKHPEYVIEIARRLKQDGYDFTANIIGNGVLEEQIRQDISKENLSDCVHLLGAMSPGQVRAHMEQSEIFLITSDQNEGWGAVLNESMNSACAVVANRDVGAAPFMIKEGKNALTYSSGNIDELYRNVKWLLDHSEERQSLSKNAYQTMVNKWNANCAVKEFLKIAKMLL